MSQISSILKGIFFVSILFNIFTEEFMQFSGKVFIESTTKSFLKTEFLKAKIQCKKIGREKV